MDVEVKCVRKDMVEGTLRSWGDSRSHGASWVDLVTERKFVVTVPCADGWGWTDFTCPNCGDTRRIGIVKRGVWVWPRVRLLLIGCTSAVIAGVLVALAPRVWTFTTAPGEAARDIGWAFFVFAGFVLAVFAHAFAVLRDSLTRHLTDTGPGGEQEGARRAFAWANDSWNVLRDSGERKHATHHVQPPR